MEGVLSHKIQEDKENARGELIGRLAEHSARLLGLTGTETETSQRSNEFELAISFLARGVPEMQDTEKINKLHATCVSMANDAQATVTAWRDQKASQS